ncbi:MAG: ABC transporter ATP-binding protein/permease [Rhodospirillales bacterium]
MRSRLRGDTAVHDAPPNTRPSGIGAELAVIGTLLPYLWPKDAPELRRRVVAAVLFLIAAKAVNVGVPVIYKHVVDALAADTFTNLSLIPVALIVAYGVARMLTQAFGELRDAAFARVGQRAIRTAGLRTFRHLHELSLGFHLGRRTGAVSRAIERGTKGIEFVLNFMLFNILPTIVEILLVCGILWFLFGLAYAAVTFVCIGIYIAFTIAVTEWRTKYRRQMNRTDSEAHAKAIDSLLNFETVKYFGNEAHEGRRFDQALRAYETAAVKSKMTLSLLNIGQGVIIAVGLIVLMLMAGKAVAAKSMTVGDFVMVNAYLIQLYLPLNFLGFVYREIKQSLIDMEAMFGLLDERPGVEDREDARPIWVGVGRIDFEDVSFGYDDRRAVLADVAFSVGAGRTLAIVGPSGAGKTTISRLLYRFYDVTRGRILIDGQDVRDVTQRSLRAAIGIVPQDAVLFNDTIRYNIAYGMPTATDAEIEAAARLARIHEFIEALPDGYRTMVGERGLKLSGGERQRVAIARTILKDPPILLLDEATSALDTHTEKEIQASLQEVARGRTTLIIAHRLSTVVDADEIIVLDGGRIVERGRHRDLLAAGGRYAAMWARQQEADAVRAKLATAGILDGGDGGSVALPAAVRAAE